MHRLRQCLHQPEITICASSIDNRHTIRRKMISYLLEKFTCRQLERHIRLLVGIDANLIILLRSRAQEVPSILHNHMQIRLVHAKILPTQINNSTIDLNTINFATGSWEIPPDQAARLQSIADGLNRAIQRNPREVFLIEGHTDAVGNPVDNLSLSDRRAESAAELLTQQFAVPAET